MTYRLLSIEEWPLLEHEFTYRGYALPDPKFAMIAAAFTDDDPQAIVGFLVCQLQMHFEPLVAHTPYCIRGLVRTLEEELAAKGAVPATYYSFTTSDAVAGICEATGMAEIKTRVYMKVLGV